MKLLGKSKIMKHRVKPEIIYPLIRLPQSEIDISGEIAHIFKTEYNSKPIYIISLDEDFKGEMRVTQPEAISDLKSRLEALEKEVFKTSKFEKKEKRDGPAEIRTQDPRRVKAMS
jgi:hypothetical protein